MLQLLKRLSSSCWGDHEWMYRTGERGLWLECRHCGHVSSGVDLSSPQYRRTQDAVPSAHRIGGVPPARLAAAVAEGAATSLALARTISTRPRTDAETASRGTLWLAPVATSDAERRWLETWRSLTPDQRVLAERLVAQIADQRVAHAS